MHLSFLIFFIFTYYLLFTILFFCFLFFVFFFSTNSPAICIVADMAECKVLKLSSHLAPSSPYRHLSHHQQAQLHQRLSSTQASDNCSSTRLVTIIICLPHTHPALLNLTLNSPLSYRQPLSCWNLHLVSIVVVLVIIMSLVVITTALPCVQQQLHLWTSSQHRKHILPNTSSKTEF